MSLLAASNHPNPREPPPEEPPLKPPEKPPEPPVLLDVERVLSKIVDVEVSIRVNPFDMPSSPPVMLCDMPSSEGIETLPPVPAVIGRDPPPI